MYIISIGREYLLIFERKETHNSLVIALPYLEYIKEIKYVPFVCHYRSIRVRYLTINIIYIMSILLYLYLTDFIHAQSITTACTNWFY